MIYLIIAVYIISIVGVSFYTGYSLGMKINIEDREEQRFLKNKAWDMVLDEEPKIPIYTKERYSAILQTLRRDLRNYK